MRATARSTEPCRVADFDLCGALRRIRRSADMSQRQLARACDVSQSAVAHAESGERDLPVGVLSLAAACAGLHLALLDANGHEVDGMADDTVRDLGRRRFPAHLDTRYSEERWWRWAHRYDRTLPWYTFDRDRAGRDRTRRRDGTPHDHQLPQVGDAPAERQAARRRAARERRRAELDRRRAAGELPEPPEFTCTCPPACDEVDDGAGRPVHAPNCPCGCDVS
jgi:transcriptional regulator with XRE-family HTH domain